MFGMSLILAASAQNFLIRTASSRRQIPVGLSLVACVNQMHSDHESVEVEEAREKLRLGMHILLREGTAARNLEQLLPLLNAHNSQNCSFVTDDKLATS
jgi:hypothetical protein